MQREDQQTPLSIFFNFDISMMLYAVVRLDGGFLKLREIQWY